MSSKIRQVSPARSTFITVLAWTFIVLSGFATLIAGLQNIAIFHLLSFDQFRLVFGDAKTSHQIPALVQFLLAHVRWIFASVLVFSSVTLVSAIGLLHRKDWARVVFVGLMGCGIAWNVAVVVLQYPLLSSLMPRVPEDAPAEFQSHFEWMRSVMMASSTIVAIAFTTLFGWIIRRLLSSTIRREFAPAL